MPHITVSIPEGKSDPLMRQLLTQFQAMQRQLQKLKAPTVPSSGSSDKMLTGMMRMMERMVGKVATAQGGGKDAAMVDAIRGMKKTMASLPTSLKSAMKSNPSHNTHTTTSLRPRVTVKPQVTISMAGMNKRFNRLEQAMANAGKSRNRTFGSNF